MTGFKKKIALFYSVFVRGWVKLRYGSRVSFGRRVILNCKFKFRGKGRLIIGDDVNLWAHEEENRFFTYDKGAIIEVGKGSRVNGVTVQARRGVKIGENCLIGSAMLVDTDFHSVDYRFRNDLEYVKSGKIEIGDDVWLAGQSVILKGVSVGERSVVGMRAVVTKDVAADVVVAGNPARVVKELK